MNAISGSTSDEMDEMGGVNPINWLIELPTVKKKLNHRQYANAEEFATEIRMLCMNPIDAALTDECLSLLQAFDQLKAKEMSETECLLVEVEAKETLLKNVKKKREAAKKAGVEVPAVPQSLLDSAHATLVKCGVMANFNQKPLEAPSP
ncbi:hypothetical protein COOONC_21508, partial [Cooperia oncophora]